VTQRQLTNLSKTHIKNASSKTLSRIFSQKRINPRLVREIFGQKDVAKTDLLINHFLQKAIQGDVSAKLFLTRLALERFTKDEFLRNRVLNKFNSLASMGDSFGLRIFLAGVRDSSGTNRGAALSSLASLAEFGEKRVLKGLIVGTKDSFGHNKSWAFLGLRSLAKKQNAEAINFLQNLAREGNESAKRILGELEE
jgi:hypothetical protein